MLTSAQATTISAKVISNEMISLLMQKENSGSIPVSILKVLKSGDLIFGFHNRTVASDEHESRCILELCIDKPQMASVWPTRVACSTLGSTTIINN